MTASRDRRIGLPGLIGREHAGQKPRAGKEADLARGIAGAVEEILEIAPAGRSICAHLALDAALVRRPARRRSGR